MKLNIVSGESPKTHLLAFQTKLAGQPVSFASIHGRGFGRYAKRPRFKILLGAKGAVAKLILNGERWDP